MTKTTISINFTPKVANDLTIDGFTLDNVEIDCTNEKFMIIKDEQKEFYILWHTINYFITKEGKK